VKFLDIFAQEYQKEPRKILKIEFFIFRLNPILQGEDDPDHVRDLQHPGHVCRNPGSYAADWRLVPDKKMDFWCCKNFCENSVRRYLCSLSEQCGVPVPAFVNVS
jgi:hypothetical protein